MANGSILAAFSKKALNQTFNITFGKAMTLYQYVKILSKYFPRLKYIFKERDHQRPKRGTLSISKAKKVIKLQTVF